MDDSNLEDNQNHNLEEEQYNQYLLNGELSLISKMDEDSNIEMYDERTCRELGLGKFDPCKPLFNLDKNKTHE
jgi:hypothetical protein